MAQLVDVTATLRGAVAELAAGESLRSPKFSLSDASLAIELFDAKLDPGVAVEPVRPLSELLPATFDLSTLEAVKIADKLLQLEV